MRCQCCHPEKPLKLRLWPSTNQTAPTARSVLSYRGSAREVGVHATGQLRGHGLHNWCYTVNIMASLFFQVLYNDKRVSALRPKLCGPIVLTGSLLQYSRCSPGAPICSLPPNKQPLCISTYCFLFVLLPSAQAKPSRVLSQRWIKPC